MMRPSGEVIWLNIGLAAVLGGVFVVGAVRAPMMVRMRLTTLDREHCFDEANLKKFAEEFARDGSLANPRSSEFFDYLCEPMAAENERLAFIGFGVCVLNIMLMLIQRGRTGSAPDAR